MYATSVQKNKNISAVNYGDIITTITRAVSVKKIIAINKTNTKVGAGSPII